MANEAVATVKMTKEDKALVQLSSAIRLFRIMHDGHLPKDWQELDSSKLASVKDLSLMLASSPLNPIDHRLYFLSKPIPHPSYANADIILISLVPSLQEGRGKGRWLIIADSQSVSRSWLPEPQVRQMLLAAGVKLPEPKAVPPVVAEPVDLWTWETELIGLQVALENWLGLPPKPGIWPWLGPVVAGVLVAVGLTMVFALVLLLRRRRARAAGK